jgi:hypothetical protein
MLVLPIIGVIGSIFGAIPKIVVNCVLITKINSQACHFDQFMPFSLCRMQTERVLTNACLRSKDFLAYSPSTLVASLNSTAIQIQDDQVSIV